MAGQLRGRARNRIRASDPTNAGGPDSYLEGFCELSAADQAKVLSIDAQRGCLRGITVRLAGIRLRRGSSSVDSVPLL